METVEDVLKHFGVKGMHWGVRRTPEERRAASNVVVKEKTARKGATPITVKSKAGRGVTSTKGGKKNVATEDAVKVRASRQKAKVSTTDSLSNDELKTVISRMQMEKQFRDLKKSEPVIARGRDVVVDLLGKIGEALIVAA